VSPSPRRPRRISSRNTGGGRRRRRPPPRASGEVIGPRGVGSWRAWLRRARPKCAPPGDRGCRGAAACHGLPYRD
jgi:hypothetical protein